MSGSPASRTPLPLIGGFALFLAVIVYAIAASFARPSVTTYEPTPPREPGIARDSAGADTVTVDASDENEWRYFDLERGGVVALPDTSGWDVAFRRHTFIVAAGARDMGVVAWDSVTRAPTGEYVATPRARDAADPALRRWYDYRMLTHVLAARANVYVVKTAEGRYAKMQILSYYCPGPRAGCPTVRYSLGILGP